MDRTIRLICQLSILAPKIISLIVVGSKWTLLASDESNARTHRHSSSRFQTSDLRNAASMSGSVNRLGLGWEITFRRTRPSSEKNGDDASNPMTRPLLLFA